MHILRVHKETPYAKRGELLSASMHFVESYLLRIIKFSTSYLLVLFCLPRGIVAQLTQGVNLELCVRITNK